MKSINELFATTEVLSLNEMKNVKGGDVPPSDLWVDPFINR